MGKNDTQQSDRVRREIQKANDLAKTFVGGGTSARKPKRTRNNK